MKGLVGEDQPKRITYSQGGAVGTTGGKTLGYAGHDAYEQDDEQFCAEVRARAVWMVLYHEADHPTLSMHPVKAARGYT